VQRSAQAEALVLRILENLGGVKLKHLLEIQTNTRRTDRVAPAPVEWEMQQMHGEWTIPLLSFLKI
jgi:hypothetical protein